MSLKANSKYKFGVEFARFMAKNYDGTKATPTRTVGGGGTFDFSGADVTISAVPLSIKLDNGAVQTKDVDLSDAVVASAVTVDEVVTAITASAFVGITASKEAVTELLLIKQTTVTASYMQVYGQLAEICLIGQGKGTKFVKCQTLKDFTSTQTEKASETITTTDANGEDTDMISDSYVKGGTGKFTDTAYDQELKALIEGGKYDSVTGLYSAPKPDSSKVYWDVEFFERIYSGGSNKQNDIVGYLMTSIESCSGSIPESSASRAWADTAYNFIATEGKDKDGNKISWRSEKMLSVVQYGAMAITTV